jgi:DNA-directed RNA polymerase specialized sigma24 family protein
VEPEQAQEGAERSLWIAEERVQNALRRYFERRASRNDVDDLVQTTLADALAAKRAPADRAEWDQWMYGIARHKLADHFRRSRNESPLDEAEAAAAESAHQEARELLKWAERELPEGEHAKTTLEVLLEEADGESIESLARARSLPPARLRQRVVRMREHFRSRWALYLAVLGVFGVTVVFVVHHLLSPPPEIAEEIRPPVSPMMDEARELRRLAFEKCRAQAFEECLKGLDSARELDPKGDAATEVVEQRAAARRALDARVPVPAPSPSSSPPAPSSRTLEVTPLPTAKPRSTPRRSKTGTGSSM